MKTIFNIQAMLLACLLAATAPVVAHDESGHAPRFGGVVVETKAGDVEIVAKTTSIKIYVSDHGKSVNLVGAKAKITLLNGTEKSETDLVVVGDKLEVKGTFAIAKGTKGIAFVTLNGKPTTTARFEIK